MKSIIAYLNFDGNCREVMNFYKQCLGGELSIMTMSQAPEGPPPEAGGDRIMHSCLTVGSASIFASDTMPGQSLTPGDNVSLTLQCDSVEEIDHVFNALSQNGKVAMPLGETFWAARFGMLTDQFGINWLLNLEKPH